MTTHQAAGRSMDEAFRPQYHYTAAKNMINDPNGLIYLDGEWHLFHQYNQHEVVHWGHAISTDLLHWEHQEPAIFPDAHGQIYSGTAVVDHDNTSGLQTGTTPVIVAAFTYADHHDGTQSQGLAFSNDRGRNWTMHPANPVLPNPGQKDFRDPKIFWHEPTDSWILVVTGGDHLEFFRSPDLTTWTYAFSWGAQDGSHGGVWECPDVFELPVEGTTETRWVISVSVDRGAPAGGSGMQYFIGHFDGHAFTNDNPPDMVLWQNWGQDYYAGITWENVPAADGRRIMIAWADNWLYRFDIPTDPFNGQLTVPRELRLESHGGSIRLTARPIAELEQLRIHTQSWGPRSVGSTPQTVLDIGDAYEIEAVFDLVSSTAAEFGVEVRVGPTQTTRIGYNMDRHVLFIDRSQSGLIPTTSFTTCHELPLTPRSMELRVRILVDRSSVEIFADGEQLTDLILPAPDSTGFRPYATNGIAALTSLDVHTLARTWADQPAPFVSLRGSWAQTDHGVRGSHTTLAIAMYADTTPADWIVTILGTRSGNPTKILGEQAAGIALTDDSGNTGIAFLADVSRQQLIARDIRTQQELLATDATLTTNTPYRFTITAINDEVEARIENVGSVRVPTAQLIDGCWHAFVVDNAEASFAGMCTS